MNTNMLRLVIFSALVIGTLCGRFNNPFEEKFVNLGQDIQLFDQVIDHANYLTPSQNNTWKQRYFVYNQFFDPKNGPVILYICG